MASHIKNYLKLTETTLYYKGDKTWTDKFELRKIFNEESEANNEITGKNLKCGTVVNE